MDKLLNKRSGCGWFDMPYKFSHGYVTSHISRVWIVSVFFRRKTKAHEANLYDHLTESFGRSTASSSVTNRTRGKKHYSDVIMGTMAPHTTGMSIVYSTVCSGEINENVKAPRHWPLWGQFNGDRSIPLTKSQWHGKCFHLVTSSGSSEVLYLISMISWQPIIWLLSWHSLFKPSRCNSCLDQASSDLV